MDEYGLMDVLVIGFIGIVVFTVMKTYFRSKKVAEEKKSGSVARTLDALGKNGKLPVSLPASVENARQSARLKTTPRRFYPGGPKWQDLPTFAGVLEYEKRGSAAQLVDVEAAFCDIRATKRESVCKACGDKIDDPEDDPPECICGEIYCCDACHEADWVQHQAACQAIEAQDQNEIIFKFTEAYWRFVLVGYFPLKDEPDFPAMYQERRQRSPVDEMSFYFTHEKEYLKAQVAAVQPGFYAAVQGQLRHSPFEEKLACHKFMMVNLLQKARMTTPLPTDSAIRLSFKLSVADTVCYLMDRVFTQNGWNLTYTRGYTMPPNSQLTANFRRMTKQGGKIEELTQQIRQQMKHEKLAQQMQKEKDSQVHAGEKTKSGLIYEDILD